MQAAANSANARHDPVGRAGSEGVSEAAEGGAGDGGDLCRAARYRGRALQRALRRDQRQQRRQRRTFEGADDPEHEGRDEYLRHREPAGKGAPGQKQRRQPFDDLANLHDAFALVAVRGVSRHEQQQRRRQELHEPDHAEIEGAAGQVVNLPADGDRADLGREPRKTARQQKQQKRFVPEQSAGADRHHRRHGLTGSCFSKREPSAAPLLCCLLRRGRRGRRCQWRRRRAARHCAINSPAAIIAAGSLEIMLQLQSALGVLALLALAWALGENRRAVSWRQAGHRAWRHDPHGAGADQIAAGGEGVRRHQRCRQHDRGRLPRRHLLRVRLSRRRRAALRSQSARRGFHPGVSGAADHPGHERADDAVVLLARLAADRARHGVAAGAHARRRRRGGALHRRQHLPRHGGSAAVHPALSGATHAQRIVSGDDRRHGRASPAPCWCSTPRCSRR